MTILLAKDIYHVYMTEEISDKILISGTFHELNYCLIDFNRGETHHLTESIKINL